MDAWTLTLTVDEALAACWTTPCVSRRRTGRRDHVSTPVAMLARFVLDAVSKIMQEGNWSLPHRPFCGVGTPGYDRLRVRPTFASFAEFSESAKDRLLGRDTQARQEETTFRHLLHFPPFATLQQKPQVNFALACWLQEWELLFWQFANCSARRGASLGYAGFEGCPPSWTTLANPVHEMHPAYPGLNPFSGTPMDANTLSSPVRRRPRMFARYGFFPQAPTGGWIACASMSHSLRAAFLCAG
jgi:hypothetical protein